MRTKKCARLERKKADTHIHRAKTYFNSRFWFCLALIAGCGVAAHDIVHTPLRLAAAWFVLLVVVCIWAFVWGREHGEW